jgi:hypothetical protein
MIHKYLILSYLARWGILNCIAFELFVLRY